MSPPTVIPIPDIKIGGRYRRYGNITPLAADVRRNGIRHPIIVTSSGQLVDGWRRIQAATRCAATEIITIESDSIPEIADIMAGMPAGEQCRFSDLMRHIDLIFELDANDAERRRIANSSSAGRGERRGGNVGGARGCACRMLRISFPTYGRARYLWARASNNQQLVADLDAGKISVNRAYDIVRAADLAARQSATATDRPDMASQLGAVKMIAAQCEGIAHGIRSLGMISESPEDADRLTRRLKASRSAITKLINQLNRKETNHA